MTTLRAAFIVFSGLLALIGLFEAAGAEDIGMSVFGWTLLAFGLAFAFFMLKRACDAEYGGH